MKINWFYLILFNLLILQAPLADTTDPVKNNDFREDSLAIKGLEAQMVVFMNNNLDSAMTTGLSMMDLLKSRISRPNLTTEQSNFYNDVFSSVIHMLGSVYSSKGDISTALNLSFEALRIAENIQNKSSEASILNSIAILYKTLGNIEEALTYYEKSIQISEAREEIAVLGDRYWNLSSLYHSIKKLPEASVALKKAAHYYARQGDDFGRGSEQFCKAVDAKYAQLPDSAIRYYKSAKSYYDATGYFVFHSNIYYSMANIYLSKGSPALAKLYTDSAMIWAERLRYTEDLMTCAKSYYQVYKKQSLWQEALQQYDTYITLRDSINNEKSQKEAIKQQMGYEFEKKEALLKAEKEKQELAHREKVKRQELIILSAGGGLLLVIIFSVFLFNRFSVARKQKNVIASQKALVDEKNKHITDSINYAQKIQEAILPSTEAFQGAFEGNDDNHFILYQPKDVVSGDFYWLHETADNKVIWVVADCTGHGVPGAFMSMIGTSLLNEIVIEKGITQSNEILNHLRSGIKRALGQSDAADSLKDGSPSSTEVSEGKPSETSVKKALPSEMTVKDGMDISLCAWNKATNELEYSGAYNPLYLIRKGSHRETMASVDAGSSYLPDKEGQNTLVEIKADRQPIGVFIKEKPFTRHTLQLQSGDSLFMFTDGFVDQFGGREDLPPGQVVRKYTPRRFRELLLVNQDRSMQEQRNILQQAFESWKKEMEQVDDVCVIGVRV